MSNIVTRIITGIFFLIAVVGSIIWHPFAFGALFLVFSILCLLEFIALTPITNTDKSKTFVLVIAALLYTLFFLVGNEILSAWYLTSVFLVVVIMAAAEMTMQSASFKNIVYKVFGIVYITIPFGLLNLVYGMESGLNDQVPWLLLSFFVLVWINDIFAYLTGSLIGRHKLLEHISPKKTWEGFAGGLLFSLLAAWAISFLVEDLSLIQWLGMAAIIVVTGVIGDLAESMLKRNAEVKDSGTLLPGHGGFLDRFDAMLLSAPAIFIYLTFISS